MFGRKSAVILLSVACLTVSFGCDKARMSISNLILQNQPSASPISLPSPKITLSPALEPNKDIFLNEDLNSSIPLQDESASTDVLREGPNSTGGLKEGPNSTGSLKIRQFYLINRDNDKETLLDLKKIKSIEIISTKGTKVINISDTIVPPNSLSIKSVSLYDNKNIQPVPSSSPEPDTKITDNNIPETEILFQRDGQFSLKTDDNEKNIILKIYIDKFSIPVVIPVFKGVIDDSITVILEKDSNLNLIVLGGVRKTNGHMDESKPMFNVISDKNNNISIELVKPEGKKETYSLKSFEEQLRIGSSVHPDKIEQVKNGEDAKYDQEDKNVPLLSINNYVGNWAYSGFGVNLSVHISDKGNGKFSAETVLNGKKYRGTGEYLPENNDTIIFVENNNHNYKVKVKIDFIDTEKINFKIEEVDVKELMIYKDIVFLFTKVPEKAKDTTE